MSIAVAGIGTLQPRGYPEARTSVLHGPWPNGQASRLSVAEGQRGARDRVVDRDRVHIPKGAGDAPGELTPELQVLQVGQVAELRRNLTGEIARDSSLELGFVLFERTGGELLFNLLADRYERRSTVVKTNLAFSEWVRVFGDEKLTTALLDRLGHHAHILTTRGPSDRIRRLTDS
ncbi:MAG: hypothetical protein F4X80_02960 [Chloroflexi bacterium]|nr:hypothetical protein [Chloroflexota bacterium]MYE31624.1 hypothetical protein [Chloroflexota bacterium]